MGKRRTKADRTAETRSALFGAARRLFTERGYAATPTEEIIRGAGASRGALYHQFKDKQELTLAVIDWAIETWSREVDPLVERESDPVAALLAMARGHAVFCRRDIARVAIALRLEFSGRDHPVGREVEKGYELLLKDCVRLIGAGRESGSIPPGPPARAVAVAFVGALEGTTIALAGQAPHDELFAARAAAGVLGLDPLAVVRHRTNGD